MKKTFLLYTALAIFTLPIFSQTADEIIDKHLEALGGKEKLLQLNTIIMEGNLSVQGTEIPIKIFQSHNKGLRVEISAMGMTGYIINTPTEGWQYLPFQGQANPEAIPAEAVKEAADQLDLQGSLINYKEKGHQVEYLGKEDFEGTECFKLKVMYKGGAEATMFLDPKTYYLLKQITKTKATGQEIEQTQTFSNYTKLAEGYVFPFAQTGFGPGEISFSKIEVNKPVDESLFKPSK
jgi:hypothetical protein